MDELSSLRSDLRGKFLHLVKSSSSEDKLIEFLNSFLGHQSDKFDIKTFEVVLDLTLAVVDQYGCIKFDHDTPQTPRATPTKASPGPTRDDLAPASQEFFGTSCGISRLGPEHVSYDADDEDFDDTFLFPCHIVYDNCHPELLSDYHREHLTPSRTTTQIVKLPKLCEFVIETVFKNLFNHIYTPPKTTNFKLTTSSSLSSSSYNCPPNADLALQRTELSDFHEPPTEELDMINYLNMIVSLVKKLNKACGQEKRNCKILSRTGMLNVLMQNLILLIEKIPDKQHLYLESLLKFSLTLADYKIQGTHLKQLFTIIKNENADLKLVLESLERLLNHHYRIMRNIQPSRSINFPTASKTPEEIEYDQYVANSWHWRLRNKVIEYKRKRSRHDSQSNEFKSNLTSVAKNLAKQESGDEASKGSDNRESQNDPATKSQGARFVSPASNSTKRNTSSRHSAARITSSWLECSMMTPLSNIGPLIHDGELKFCCSMWISVCGDLLVIDGTKVRQRRKHKPGSGENFNIDWSQIDGHWLRLTSRRRLVRRYKNKVVVKTKARKRRPSVSIRTRQAFDKEDEELEEIEEKVRRSDAETTVQMNPTGRDRFKLFYSSLSRHTRNSAIKKQRDNILKKTKMDSAKSSKRRQSSGQSNIPLEFSSRKTKDDSQDLLVHLVSFAIDSLTIEIWLNVKTMTFCARACRVTREGQTNLLDQVNLPSHLESNGRWSNLMFCFEEQGKSASEQVMNFKVIVNAIHKEKEKLVYSAHRSPLTNFALLIGCERSTFGYVWKLSQINIYKSIPDKSMPTYFLGKGPDFWSFTNFHQHSLLPLEDVVQRYPEILMNPKILSRYSSIDEEQALNWLTKNIMISYVAHQPDHFMDYSPSITSASLINTIPADYEFSNSAERFIQAKTLDFSRSTRFNQNMGFGSALAEAGGIESVLICFAEVVRRSHETAQVHALAFSVLLKFSQTNSYHLNKFLDELNGLKLLEFLLEHPSCKISRPMLEHYLNYCLLKQGERFLIKSPKLMFHLLTSWKAWHKDPKVARVFYKRLIKLLQPPDMPRLISRHLQEDYKLRTCYIHHNFRMMSQAGAIDILLDVLRESLLAVDEHHRNQNSTHINHELVELIINLISLLIKHPPGLDVILDIMEFLLFLHPDPKAYVEVSADKIAFLHRVKPWHEDTEVVLDEPPSRVRTPSTRSSRSSLHSSDEPANEYRNAHGSGSQILEKMKHSMEAISEQSSEDELYASLGNRISDQCSRNLAEMMADHCEPRISQSEAPTWIRGKLADIHQEYADQAFKPYQVSYPSTKCSNRDFAIAGIADMLASIVKLASTDPMRILSETLQKPIIDPRKLVILANNESPLVREKVFRLFLYCIRACYTLRLEPVLARFEQDTKSANYRICIPMHLMARQLLKHPTTVRMIQLCYGIIMGVDDFETVDTVCLIFDIETVNNHLQLNTLVLLMHLLTQLRTIPDIVPGLQFVHAYLKQLLQQGESTTVGVLIQSNLVDCLMNLYFNYVENVIANARDSLKRSKSSDLRPENANDESSDSTDQVVEEIDSLLIFVVRFYVQLLSTAEMIKSVEELLLYFDLLNTYLPHKYHFILRDRKVKILMVLVRYCRHYEEFAKQQVLGSKFQYFLKSLLNINDLNCFHNNLPESELTSLFERNIHNLRTRDSHSEGEAEPGDEARQQNGNGLPISQLEGHEAIIMGPKRNSQDSSIGRAEDPEQADSRNMSETDVIDRFKAVFKFIERLVTLRSLSVIPSPLERNFVLRNLELLANYLITSTREPTDGIKHRTQWNLMLAQLEDSLRKCFTRLVLYLMSPCEAMNIDERKYYAHQLLEMFSENQLMDMLENEARDQARKNQKLLLVFVKELLDYSYPNKVHRPSSSEDNGAGSDFEDDEMIDETVLKLKRLILGLEFDVSDDNNSNQSRLSNFVYGKRMKTTSNIVDGNLSKLETKIRDVWLEELSEHLERHRNRVLELKADFQASVNCQTGVAGLREGNGSEDRISSSTDDFIVDRFLDEAFKITKDVVNDKHEQRKAYLEDVKQSKIYNYHIRQQWLSLIIGHTHERAIWFLEDFYPKSWELNPVEGPSRTRKRLRPCKLTLESRFLRKKHGDRHHNAIFPDVVTNNPLDRSSIQSSPLASRSSRLDDEIFADDWYNQYSPHPLCSLVINSEENMDSRELRIRMFTTDKIHFNCDCNIIRPNEVCIGEVSIASWCIHFIGERSNNYQRHLNGCSRVGSARPMLMRHNSRQLNDTYIGPTRFGYSVKRVDRKHDIATTFDGEISSPERDHHTSASPNSNRIAYVPTTIVEDLWFDEIVEIWDRRYQLQDVGLEIFLTNNMTYLMSFRTNSDREHFKQHLMREQHKMINLQRFNLTTSLNRLTLLWREGKLTNFDYLTCLNKLAGRSFNDLMQYPVFPFVLSNYSSECLDLTEAANYRDLARPMAIQQEAREVNFKNNYQMCQSTNLCVGSSLGLSKPYHYGNHYSNSATVLHFLVRLPPFTQMLIQYQDNNFDQPDRTFHSIANTWQLITRDSNTDFKELIPEFFFLPEMLTNIENLELGRKQNNELVDDVRLPVWCPKFDARLFTLIHRQALESAHVSQNLHRWIDLIFGYKQTGKAAVDAINVFHPATYYGGVDLSSGRGTGSQSSSSVWDSLSAINSAIATRSTKSSTHGSENNAPANEPAQSGNQPKTTTDSEPARSFMASQFHQAEIERSALETMIKTYGQMPRQLFSVPMKQRKDNTFVPQINEVQLEKQQEKLMAVEHGLNGKGKRLPERVAPRKLEPMRQVKGLRWGNYVGSPDDKEVIAVKYKRIILDEPLSYRAKSNSAERAGHSSSDGPKLLSKRSDKFHFCLLTNGDVAILRNNTSLMLDYRADRKSGANTYQQCMASARYTRRAGLSRVSRLNLFSNMIISRQQFSFLEPVYSAANQPNAFSAPDGSSTLASLTGGSRRAKFSLDSLNLVSWFYLDGTLRVKHPATSNLKPSIPLVQANSIVDTMSKCASVPELNLLLIGYKSGSICAHIVSTSYETAPLPRYIPTISTGASTAAAAALSAHAAAPSAVHSLHTTSTHGIDISLLGPGRVTGKTITGQPYSAISLAGKTLQSVRSMNKTTRWLYCHNKRVNCIKINISFGIVVSGSDDGTSVIWDLNSLTYVRTIDYKIKSLRLRHNAAGLDGGGSSKQAKSLHQHASAADEYIWTYGRASREKVLDYLCSCHSASPTGSASSNFRSNSRSCDTDTEERQVNCSINDYNCMMIDMMQQCSICASGISLIAISDTLGDIVTVKNISNRTAMAATEPNDEGELNLANTKSAHSMSETCSLTGSSLSGESDSMTSVIYVHTINGSLVNFVNCHTQVTALTYSNAPEGISINVIVVGMMDGLVRLYSSWDLSRVKEFRVSGLCSPISDIMYTRDSQLMYIAYEDGQMVVLRNKKKGSISMPKEWIL